MQLVLLDFELFRARTPASGAIKQLSPNALGLPGLADARLPQPRRHPPLFLGASKALWISLRLVHRDA